MAALMAFTVAMSMTVAAAVSLAMLVAVMVAVYVRIVCKRSGCQCLHSFIRVSGYAAVKPDSSLRQSVLRACSNTAADQRIHLQAF